MSNIVRNVEDASADGSPAWLLSGASARDVI